MYGVSSTTRRFDSVSLRSTLFESAPVEPGKFLCESRGDTVRELVCVAGHDIDRRGLFGLKDDFDAALFPVVAVRMKRAPARDVRERGAALPWQRDDPPVGRAIRDGSTAPEEVHQDLPNVLWGGDTLFEIDESVERHASEFTSRWSAEAKALLGKDHHQYEHSAEKHDPSGFGDFWICGQNVHEKSDDHDEEWDDSDDHLRSNSFGLKEDAHRWKVDLFI